jgi:hypothetical protein
MPTESPPFLHRPLWPDLSPSFRRWYSDAAAKTAFPLCSIFLTIVKFPNSLCAYQPGVARGIKKESFSKNAATRTLMIFGKNFTEAVGITRNMK